MYRAILVCSHGDPRANEVSAAIKAEAGRLQVEVEVEEFHQLPITPISGPDIAQVVLYLGSLQTLRDPECNARVREAKSQDFPIVPIVDGSASRDSQIPAELEYNLAVTWPNTILHPLKC